MKEIFRIGYNKEIISKKDGTNIISFQGQIDK
jgi:hypothetical protein